MDWVGSAAADSAAVVVAGLGVMGFAVLAAMDLAVGVLVGLAIVVVGD